MKIAFMSTSWWITMMIAGGCLLADASLLAQPTNQANDLRWYDARSLTVEGKGWQETRHFYDRWPARAEPKLRGALWSLGEDSAGLAIRFVTDATAISARWTLRRERLAMPHMPASGVSGLDLYVWTGKNWQWVGGGRPDKSPKEEKRLVGGLTPSRREYLLYLPLYNGLEELEIGVPSEAIAQPAPLRPAGLKPIVFYGTSIVQGGCASRPGMTYPAILGRRLGRAHINMGFSGNAWGEPEVAQFLAELDPAVFVLDPLPNMKEEWVAPRLERFVGILRQAHPKTPIVLVENLTYADADFVVPRRERCANANARLRELHRRLVRAGDKYLFYVSAAGLIGSDGEGTVDGTHPTDLGFQRMAEALEPTVRRALKSAR